jgi:hypothetical protein
MYFCFIKKLAYIILVAPIATKRHVTRRKSTVEPIRCLNSPYEEFHVW